VSFELHHRKHIEDELTKIVRQQLRTAAHALTTSEGSQFQSAVHESRKSIKKVRAVAAFLTQAGAKLPRRDRKRLKSAARALSRVRDSTAIIDTFDRVRRRYPKQLPSTPTEFSAVAWSRPAIETKRVRNATASSPKPPSAWRRHVSR
jgi:CHAD domain-containing protein